MNITKEIFSENWTSKMLDIESKKSFIAQLDLLLASQQHEIARLELTLSKLQPTGKDIKGAEGLYVKCKKCDGFGYTSEHNDLSRNHETGEHDCSHCPIQVQCEECKANGYIEAQQFQQGKEAEQLCTTCGKVQDIKPSICSNPFHIKGLSYKDGVLQQGKVSEISDEEIHNKAILVSNLPKDFDREEEEYYNSINVSKYDLVFEVAKWMRDKQGLASQQTKEK
jgi:hypothetical protein